MNKEESREARYNYRRFSEDLMVERFEGGPEPGAMAPDFAASTLEGETIRLSNHRGRRHVVLQFGSVT